MGYFDDENNVEEYVKMADGYDGRQLIEVLRTHLKLGSTVLELGMGPGKDFEFLSEYYQVTGSDNSEIFLKRYREKDAGADLVLLDALTMNIDRRFDCIYSNKVLHHLAKEELGQSLRRQANVLNENGILLHSFWIGEGEEEMSGLRFTYYTKATLAETIGAEYEVLSLQSYSEMTESDSIILLLRKVGSRPV